VKLIIHKFSITDLQDDVYVHNTLSVVGVGIVSSFFVRCQISLVKTDDSQSRIKKTRLTAYYTGADKQNDFDTPRNWDLVHSGQQWAAGMWATGCDNSHHYHGMAVKISY